MVLESCKHQTTHTKVNSSMDKGFEISLKFPHNTNRKGQGTAKFVVGGKYVGNWENNLPHGKGTYTDDSGIKYQGRGYFKGILMVKGDWRYGKQHGRASMWILDPEVTVTNKRG